MKIAGTTSRMPTSTGSSPSTRGIASKAAFHVSALNATENRFATSAAST